MQMTPEARAWLDGAVRRILARHALGDAERAGITYELMSHLHAAGEARAAAAGRDEVTRQDLELALMEAGGDEGLAAAFVAPLAKPLARASVPRRAGAFALDAIGLLLVLAVVHDVLARVLDFVAPGPAPAGEDDGWWGLFPWGYHGHDSPVSHQIVIALASLALVLGYFAWTEAREGRTLGKRILELRVMRDDGQPVTMREALIRNVVKLQPFLLALDTLIMLLAYGKEKQRASDRIARTIVVRA